MVCVCVCVCVSVMIMDHGISVGKDDRGDVGRAKNHNKVVGSQPVAPGELNFGVLFFKVLLSIMNTFHCL